MIPVGYMAKNVSKKTEGLEIGQVIDIYSVSSCISENFANYIPFWKHNGYWFFDSPDVIKGVACENSIQLESATLFYYETYEQQFNGGRWYAFAPEPSFPLNVSLPTHKTLEGFDVVTYGAQTSPECSPLSCNGMAKTSPVNAHCLFADFQEAKTQIEDGTFKDCEPGPYRIFAVYSVDWPRS